MPSGTTTCTGCDHRFSLRGYQFHLAQTRDPLCRAVFDKLKKAHDACEQIAQAAAPVPFAGDIFGTAVDYASDMFGQDDHPNLEGHHDIDALDFVEQDHDMPPLMEVSDDEESDDDVDGDGGDEVELATMYAELERSWEPPREGAPAGLPQHLDHNQPSSDAGMPTAQETEAAHCDNDSDNEYGLGNTSPTRNADRFIIGDGYGVKPAIRTRYSDQYPSARAGQALTHAESKDTEYGTSLGGGDNPWAPFNSQMDWEVAKWAKL